MDLSHRIGAFLTPAGCFFRVWAPTATAVEVLIQDGPQWELSDAIVRQPLAEAGGYWSGTVPGVRADQLYRYRITAADGRTLERLDPAARDVLHSDLTRHDPDSRNGSVVPAGDPVAWANFRTPRFDEFAIYQFHVGSFAGRNDAFDTGWATFEHAEAKLGYVRDLGFTCVQLLPVQEYAADRSWGYNPASFFAPETSYGSPADLRRFVDAAHRHGLAVIFDVVYNHAGPGDNVLWEFDGHTHQGGIYIKGGWDTKWGRGPAWWKREVRDFFYQNARMYLDEYRADGLRFDVTTAIDGTQLAQVVGRLRDEYPDKYFVAEHLPDHPWITKDGRFCATWHADTHHECQRALNGDDPVNRVLNVLGWDGYDHPWNLVKYALGSHDDVGDQNGGNAEDGLTNWDKRHRYLIDQLGGRGNWHARAKCRLAWALTVAMPGTPLLFMGSECHMAAPHVGWGYWHDGGDDNGDHRFDWSIAGDPTGVEMRRLVAAANAVRRENAALRADHLDVPHVDPANRVIGFVRQAGGSVVLTVVNLGDTNFGDHSYGVDTGGRAGRWEQILCTQDAAFGGWDGAGNAFHEPWTQADGRVYVNLPQWSVVMLRRL